MFVMAMWRQGRVRGGGAHGYVHRSGGPFDQEQLRCEERRGVATNSPAHVVIHRIYSMHLNLPPYSSLAVRRVSELKILSQLTYPNAKRTGKPTAGLQCVDRG